MNKELISQLIEIIKSTKDFVLSQAPDVAKQIVLVGRVTESAYMLGSLLLFLLTFIIYKVLYTKTKNGEWDGDAWIFGLIPLLVTFIPGIINISTEFQPWVMAWFAPKLYLLTYLAQAAHG